MDEERLLEKLRRIEALYARPGSEGERAAAESARERILERLRELEGEDPPVELVFRMPDHYSRRVLLALLRRYEIEPYRYSGQRYTTVVARMSRRFAQETIEPELREFMRVLREYLDEVTTRVVADVLHEDVSEPEAVNAPPQLPEEAAPASGEVAKKKTTTRGEKRKKKRR